MRKRRQDLIAELDAVVALLYGLSRPDVEHIFATFHRGWDYRPRLGCRTCPLRPVGHTPAGNGEPVTGPSAEDADFRPTFATNRPGTGETVAGALNDLLHGMRTHLAVAPPVAIATAFFNPGGFRLLADELEKVGPVRLLARRRTQPRRSCPCPAAGRRAGSAGRPAAAPPRAGRLQPRPDRGPEPGGVHPRGGCRIPAAGGLAARPDARPRMRHLVPRWRSAGTPAGSCTARRSSSPQCSRMSCPAHRTSPTPGSRPTGS